jgi:cytochrome c peroxidase
MARMVDNEFRVASRGSGRDPWFAIETASQPWLASIEGLPARLSPVLLRRSLMRFLMDFNHAPNPAVRGRDELTPTEQRGAVLFRDHCESCHSARLLADDPASKVPFERWKDLILGSGAIVWGRAGYEKTGVEPYVSPRGARVPSLRRLYVKRPYFTNGSAATLDEVLARVVLAPQHAGEESNATFAHAGSARGRQLDDEDRAALLAFLRLL